jgi:predicted metal-dependent enzyme (double-stranded beta helix superfamily)
MSKYMSTRKNANDVRDLFHFLPEVGRDEATEFMAQLVHNPAFVATQIVPFLTWAAPARAPSIPMSYGAREASTCLQVFVWPAGATTPIHDHTSWGAYHCVIGSLFEQRYSRFDDGEQPSTARLRKAWQRTWRSEDGTSMVLPYEKGIHRITNPNTSPAISLHMYGPRSGAFDGRDYDPERDFVCDRLEYDTLAPFQQSALQVSLGGTYL